MANFKVKRWWVGHGEFGDFIEIEDPKGEWVKFDDIKDFLPSTSNNTQSEEIKPCKRSGDCAHERVTGKCLGIGCGVYLPA